eukprot:TRINITY_DN75369_c0_g1_i1.p1 TRINITY_DN75369_c0_g1~~TRINITY_DN75369_c0_g1_i1.p1  ORF type:complete len:329 (-),score=62.44 TRINITY_DN75369_c0_g1_i1:70-1056(-)
MVVGAGPASASAEWPEVGFIFQCTLCGSYLIFAVGALDPAEVDSRAAALTTTKKVLQKDIHAAEQVLLEREQLRVAHKHGRFVLLPCATCVEICCGRTYGEWLDDTENLAEPVGLVPQVAVTFDAEEDPPAYVRKSGKWMLAQGVGPQDLELKLPHRLPAGQFRTLLPPEAPPIKPLCWRSKQDDEIESPQVWEERRQLISSIAELAAGASREDSQAEDTEGRVAAASAKRGKAPKRAGVAEAVPVEIPLMGDRFPWLDDLCVEAEQTWQEGPGALAKTKGGRRKNRPQNAGEANAGPPPCYVKVPLLQVAAALMPTVDALMFARGVR